MNKRNATVIVLATTLMVFSIIGVVFIGQVINPPTVPVVVALADIPVGTLLTEDLFAIDNVRVNPKILPNLVLESELSAFVGGTVVKPITSYEFLLKSSVSAEGNPASSSRISLALSDPLLVAMVVPVTQETSPDAIVEGDYVDLSFGVGSNTSFGNRLTTAEEADDPFAPSFPTFVEPSPIPLIDEEIEPTPTPTIEPMLMLPVAKTLVEYAKVLSIIREERTVTTAGPLTGGQSTQPRTAIVKGKILGIVVAIPREAQELVQFAIDNGIVRISVLSAEAVPDSNNPTTLGMTWNDLVALIRMDREAVLTAGLPTDVIGPGAYAVEATRNAATQLAVEQTRQATTPTPESTHRLPDFQTTPTPTALP